MLSLKVFAETDLWEKVAPSYIYRVNSIETIPNGIVLAGIVRNPDNSLLSGLFLSEDFGKTWKSIGLEGREPRDVKYYKGSLYVTTFYTIDGTSGLFESKDTGKTWTNIGPRVSLKKVNRDANSIYLGTYNSGLYVSLDGGETWENNLGENGGMNWRPSEIQSSEKITIVSTPSGVFKSKDHGRTWVEVEELSKKDIYFICINGNNIFAVSGGTSSDIFLSRDLGETWESVNKLGYGKNGDVAFFENKYYVGKENQDTKKQTVYYTSDLGQTWTNTNLELDVPFSVKDISTVFSEPSYIFVSFGSDGLYKYKVPKFNFESNQFLSIPWDQDDNEELIDRVTSYFDHSYPLLGYSYFLEPVNEKSTTLNFLGIKGKEPNIYYSSHSGIDFGLNYGSKIKAPASGVASYYHCGDCGHSIKIDHLNGYQTTYMHLQEEGLITKTEGVFVNEGDMIGKVGLTGRTTGPHLHFEVTKDTNLNNNFWDEFPNGRVDPFGWLSANNNDPWETFSWEDSLGSHKGAKSFYLWKHFINETSEIISSGTSPQDDNKISLDNKTITFPDSINNFVAKIYPYIKPNEESFLLKRYIPKTSFIAEIYDQIGNKISEFENPLEISIKIDPKHLIGIDVDSLKIYFFDEILNIWKEEAGTFDKINNVISTTINHLSRFAVLADKNIPETNVEITGSNESDWYTEFPTIKFFTSSNDQDIDFTLYSIDERQSWNKYTGPFKIQKDGVTKLLFRSQTLGGDMEQEKHAAVGVNTQGRNTKKIKVIGATFTTSN
jgi:murein DD-endopeptidase MepM/ murein hydrolase activator NlpD